MSESAWGQDLRAFAEQTYLKFKGVPPWRLDEALGGQQNNREWLGSMAVSQCFYRGDSSKKHCLSSTMHK